MRRGVWAVVAWALASPACERPPADRRADIEAVLRHGADAWNRGDLAGFMSDYAPDSTLSYVSGRGVQYGWHALYERYERGSFAPGKLRDSLAFSDLAVRALDDDLVLATARFALLRGDSTVASGPFTLILRRRDGRWLIVHDHTSSDPNP
jgi:uncharacterized protein (TIGR02246 family)